MFTELINGFLNHVTRVHTLRPTPYFSKIHINITIPFYAYVSKVVSIIKIFRIKF